MDNKTIKFGETTIKLPHRLRSLDRCKHSTVELDDDAKMIRCVKCRKFLSSYDFLKKHMQEYNWTGMQLSKMKQETQLQIRINEGLKKDERNTKARIRKANDKLILLEKAATTL